MANIMRTEYPIIARWQKNMTRLHANQPVIIAYHKRANDPSVYPHCSNKRFINNT